MELLQHQISANQDFTNSCKNNGDLGMENNRKIIKKNVLKAVRNDRDGSKDFTWPLLERSKVQSLVREIK